MALFHPATDFALRIAFGAFVSAPIISIVGLMLLARSPLGTSKADPVEQPVEFDHRHHAADEGLDCRYCHDTVTRSSTAGIPPSSRCMGCHAQVWAGSERLAGVRARYFDDAPIPWVKVHRLPDFVFFNHAIHVNKGVGCVTCHGRVDQMARVAPAASLTMGWCLDCHRDPAPHLRPLDAVTQMNWEPNGSSELGSALMHELDVRPRTECTTCHR